MWIKICGNTRLEDCQAAADAGADAVGFIFAHGKRLITAEHAAGITSQLPASIETIGVFTQTNAAYILATAAAAGLTGVQLHSDFNAGRAAIIRRYFPRTGGRRRVLQVVPWWTDVAAAEQIDNFRKQCAYVLESGLVDAILVDSRTKDASGGTGIAFDWQAAAPALHGLTMPVIVAGGLDPANVAEAVRVLQPDGVDVSSGVELSPGIKDHAAMREFMANARR